MLYNLNNRTILAHLLLFKLIELRLLKNIHLKEFLNVAWTRKDKLEKAPGIISITQRFNMVRL